MCRPWHVAIWKRRSCTYREIVKQVWKADIRQEYICRLCFLIGRAWCDDVDSPIDDQNATCIGVIYDILTEERWVK